MKKKHQEPSEQEMPQEYHIEYDKYLSFFFSSMRDMFSYNNQQIARLLRQYAMIAEEENWDCLTIPRVEVAQRQLQPLGPQWA